MTNNAGIEGSKGIEKRVKEMQDCNSDSNDGTVYMGHRAGELRVYLARIVDNSFSIDFVACSVL